MIKEGITLIALVTLAGCGSSGASHPVNNSAAHQAASAQMTTSTPASRTWTPLTDGAQTTVTAPPPAVVAVHKLNDPAEIDHSDGSFQLTVIRLGNVIKPNGNPNYTLGAIVAVQSIGGSSQFDTSMIGTFPRKNGSTAEDGTNDQNFPDALAQDKHACDGVPLLHDALWNHGIDYSDSGIGYSLTNTAHPIVGCVVFTYDRPYTPTAIALYNGSGAGTPAGRVLDQWGVNAPTKVKHTSSDVILRVTGNGSSSLVTWGIGTSISQDTSAGIPWTRKVTPNANFYLLSAQDNDGSAITCTITGPGGQVLDRESSQGSYAIASCSTSG